MNTIKPNLLCIDDESRILRSLKVIFRRTHNVYTTTSPAEFEQLLKTHHMHVIISDQRMPKVTGTELLSRAAEWSPNSMRILLTGYADLAAVIDSINEGEIFRYLTKPWDNEELKIVVEKATEIGLQLAQRPQALPLPEATSTLPSDDLSLPFPAHTAEQPPVLFIDENKASVQHFCDKFAAQYAISHAENFDDVEKLLASQQFCVVIINVEFDGEDLAPLIFLLKEKQPTLVSIVLSHFDDIGYLIDLINKGQVFRCLPNPVGDKILARSLQRAVKKHKELIADTQQQLRYQVEAPEKDAPISKNILKLSGLVRRIGRLIRA